MKFLNEEEWKGSSESVAYTPGYGFIIALVLFTLVMIVIGGGLFWYIPTVGLKSIHPSLPYATGAVFLTIAVFMLAGISVMAVSLIKGRDVLPSPRYRWLLIRFFLPLMMFMGGILKIPRIKIEQTFLDLNNRMVRAMVKKGRRISRDKILILMPHCIQYEDCKIKVTKDVKNCVGCGRCEIGGLLGLSDEYGINLFVLTGGTVARRKLYEYRPVAVIAVACERDLTSGVQDAYPLPVVTVVNKRPRGYCVQTGVDIKAIKNAILDLVGDDRVLARA